MNDLREFASSSNGDKWFVEKDATTNLLFVLHRGNAPSGGHETRSTVDAFLNQRPFGPEHEALIAFVDKKSVAGNTAVADDERQLVQQGVEAPLVPGAHVF